MPSLIRFLAGFLLGFGLACLGFLALFSRQLGVPTASSSWCYEINVKKLRLVEAAPRPRLLLVGGSATLFGLSARQIQEHTGRPTINLGTHAALGAKYILARTRTIAQRGDTVLLAFEYDLYDHRPGVRRKGWFDTLSLDYVLARDPDYFRAMPLIEQWCWAMRTSNDRIKEGLHNRRRPPGPIRTEIYSVTNINEFGDQVHHPAALRPPTTLHLTQCCSNLVTGLSAHPTGFPFYESFCDWARTNQVRVLATFPGICHRPEYDLPPAKEATQAISRFFTSLGVPVLGDAREAMLPADQFFDTMYHPTDEGQAERTRRLLVHLAPLIQQPSINSGGEARSGP